MLANFKIILMNWTQLPPLVQSKLLAKNRKHGAINGKKPNYEIKSDHAAKNKQSAASTKVGSNSFIGKAAE